MTNQPPPELAALEVHMAKQSQAGKQAHYFFTCVSWGMQLAAVIMCTLWITPAAYFSRQVTYKITSHGPMGPYPAHPPDIVLIAMHTMFDTMMNYGFWLMIMASSLYLAKTYGLRQIMAYIGPVAVTGFLIQLKYDAIGVVEWWQHMQNVGSLL